MIQVQELLKKTLLKEEEKFFHGLSFVVISLITIHIAIYFNFYTFSSIWLESESKKTTITENIEDFLSNENKLKYKIIQNDLIKESLGLTNFSDMSGLRLPFIFQIETGDREHVDNIYAQIINLSENRLTEKYSHRDELFEISSLVSRIKLIIFMMSSVIVILFSFLVMNVVKAALVSNFKFLEMLQIMGASSFELSKNISQSVIRKIIPGAILSIIFVYFVSILLIKLFGVNFDFFNTSFFFEINIKTLITLVTFILLFLVLLLFFLMSYLFYFFEKRFFDKF